jgi:hypothetical protein
MYLPNYQNGSIVNLMSSILRACGGTSPYAPLPALSATTLAATKNIVLLVLDGLGYEYLLTREQSSILHQNLKGKMTTVFPSTTASGITSFLTGLAPQQHVMTGWFMYVKELGAIATTLQFQPRSGGTFRKRERLQQPLLFDFRSIFSQITRQAYMVNPKEFATTEYTLVVSAGVQTCYYTSLPDCLGKIAQIITTNAESKIIYAYWDNFDDLCHKYGTKSPEAARHFDELVQKISALAQSLTNSNTALIITADHGLIDTEAAKVIQLKHHPEFYATLALPLCGEPRTAYCYVRPTKTAQFEAYVERHFSAACDLYRSEELIKNHYFGLFEPEPRLLDRVGDYVLIMRDNYIIKDFLLNEEEKINIGNHGGVSKEEMFVPLVMINL